METEVKESVLARQQRDIVQQEFSQKETQIEELRKELDKCQAENSALEANQVDLEVYGN